MRMHSMLFRRGINVLSALVALASLLENAAAAGVAEFGRPATPVAIAAIDIDVTPDGSGLPVGAGTVENGRVVYATQCAGCHGITGSEGPRDRLVGGQGSLTTDKPIKTVGSYWQYAPTLFDYINRAMPFTAPGTLTPNEVYSLVAFLLSQNGIISATATIDRNNLPMVKMPNRDGFIVEPQFRNVKRK